MNDELIESARQHLSDLLSFFEINADVRAELNEDTIKLSVETDTGGRLIGHRGETLAALQHIMNMMIRHQTTERVYVHVDIGGYRQARLEKLEEQAREAVEQVKTEGEEVTLPMMSPAERRHIHAMLT
ncbi:MAG TPA: KH domain-containing protein, partial [Candidatus Polarisedimenticolaceae bacterium]|nr:KH domain-containing protein [Candidatus Polarisedimenticolaceae bacterium]